MSIYEKKNYRNKKWLINEYIIKQKSINKIARDFNHSINSLRKWLKIYNIKIRDKNHPIVNNQKKKFGKDNYFYYKTFEKENHPNWKGGPPKCVDCKKTISWGSKRCLDCLHLHFSGRNHANFGKINSGYIHKCGKYKDIWMRSSWELNFAKWLDLSGIKWKYESKTFDLGDTTYTPDFYLPEFDCYIEIKGWKTKSFKYKFKSFLKKFKNINIKLYDYKNLKCMGIIK